MAGVENLMRIGCQSGYGPCNGASSSSLSVATSTLTALAGTSTDKCGHSNQGLVCAPGLCCSQYGYCGKTNAYYKTACQSGFGTCSESSSSSSRGINPESSPSMGNADLRASTLPILRNSRCGNNFGGQTCQGSSHGNCCSQYGYCGKTDAYCKTGCQPRYGFCSVSPSIGSRSTSRSSTGSSSTSSHPASLPSTSTSGPTTGGPSTIPSTLLPTLPQSASDLEAFNRDPLEYSGNFDISRTSDLIRDIIINDPDSAHYGNGYNRVTSTDANGASLTASTQITLHMISGQTVATSPNAIPVEWTSISGYYTLEDSATTLILSIIVECPAVELLTLLRFIKRQTTEPGLDLDDLTMAVDDSSGSSSSSVIMSTIQSRTPTPISTTLELTLTTISTTTEPTPIIITTTSSSTPCLTSISESTLTSAVAITTTSAELLSTPLQLPCSPTLIDGGFEIAGSSSSTSEDWGSLPYIDDGKGTYANLRYEGAAAYDGQYGYTIYTNNSDAWTYDIKYLHPLSLCAGTEYHVSSWIRNNRRASSWTEGCRITAFLDGQQAWSDRVGYYDWNYQYLDGTVTPTADVKNAEFYIRVECRAPQTDNYLRPRGIKLDDIAIAAASNYVEPAGAAPITTI
ncbi:hypothetical protein CC78DRAFT_574575 [Lojkania enalia]|uniref:Chitin-binding type-1 domain-containing protein n=1 Tax=Lojkania enalia TaxID=147567 RepID=A0A9P4NAK9_9PLEO|nr:hypothetical protein CC78DRAFT_574575 [Didymosphaeria enalia]